MTRLATSFVWVALTGTCVTACGGSSSETPFPQAPLERRVEARHDAARPTMDPEPSTPAAPTSSAATDIKTPTSK